MIIIGGIKIAFNGLFAALALSLCLCLGLGSVVAEEYAINFTEIGVPLITNGTLTLQGGSIGTIGGNQMCDDSGCSGSAVFWCNATEKMFGLLPLVESDFDGSLNIEVIGDNGVPFHIPAPVDENLTHAWLNVTTEGGKGLLTISW